MENLRRGTRGTGEEHCRYLAHAVLATVLVVVFAVPVAACGNGAKSTLSTPGPVSGASAGSTTRKMASSSGNAESVGGDSVPVPSASASEKSSPAGHGLTQPFAASGPAPTRSSASASVSASSTCPPPTLPVSPTAASPTTTAPISMSPTSTSSTSTMPSASPSCSSPSMGGSS
jgi:hypothetical protein